MNTRTHFPRTGTAVIAGAVELLPAVVAAKPLTQAEDAQLARCELGIRDGLDRAAANFREIGRHLSEIADGRLYRTQFPTIEAYCQSRWGFSARRMQQFRTAAAVVKALQDAAPEANNCSPALSAPAGMDRATPSAAGTDLSPAVPARVVVLPRSESQVRPLAGMSPARQVDIWDESVRAANGKQPTAAQVKAAAKRTFPKPNEHGVYRDEDAERIPITVSGGSACIYLLEIRPGQWIEAHSMSICGIAVGAGSHSSPLAGKSYPSRTDALIAAAGAIQDITRHKTYESHNTKHQAVAKKILQWTEQLEAETKRDLGYEAPSPKLQAPIPGRREELLDHAAKDTSKAIKDHFQKKVMEQAYRVVVELRALRDLVHQVGCWCWYVDDATCLVERLEGDVEHGRKDTSANQARHRLCDALACMGGVEEFLRESGDEECEERIGRAFVALGPVVRKYADQQNLRVIHWEARINKSPHKAAIAAYTPSAAKAPGNRKRPKISAPARAAIAAAAKARWAKMRARR